MGCRTLPITLPRVAGIARTAGLTMRVRSFDCDIDVMDLICLEDVMEEFGLGPNGGMCCPAASGVPAVPAVTSPPTCVCRPRVLFGVLGGEPGLAHRAARCTPKYATRGAASGATTRRSLPVPGCRRHVLPVRLPRPGGVVHAPRVADTHPGASREGRTPGMVWLCTWLVHQAAHAPCGCVS